MRISIIIISYVIIVSLLSFIRIMFETFRINLFYNIKRITILCRC